MAHRDDRNRGMRDRNNEVSRRDLGGRSDYDRDRYDYDNDASTRGRGRNEYEDFSGRNESDPGSSYRGGNTKWSSPESDPSQNLADDWRPGGMRTTRFGESSLSGRSFTRDRNEEEFRNPDYRDEGRFGETYRDENFESWRGGRGSAFSNYQDQDYGANTQHWDSARTDRDMRPSRARQDDRDWNSPAYRDEGFFGGGSQTNRNWTGPHAGKGPQNYRRSDERIHEDVCERLTMHGQIDATNIDVKVNNGEVTLSGSVDNRQAKRLAEDAIEDVPGVRDINNQLRVTRGQTDREHQVTTQSETDRTSKKTTK